MDSNQPETNNGWFGDEELDEVEQTKVGKEEKAEATSITSTKQVLEQFQQERMEEIQRKMALSETKTIVRNERYVAEGRDVNMLQVKSDKSLAMTAGEWWEDNDLSHAYTDEGWKSNTPDDTWYMD